MFEPVVATLITSMARTVTGARSLWLGCAPVPVQRIYFANHSSHGDFVLLWASLPQNLRKFTRPVAGSDYWSKSALRRYIINRVFNGVLIDRERKDPVDNPLQPMLAALEGGDSLILFPEGTRNETDQPLLPFKSGLFNLATSRPEIDLVPVWIDNLNRVMPKGEIVPIPLICTVTFGEPLRLLPDESREDFLARTTAALFSLSPKSQGAAE